MGKARTCRGFQTVRFLRSHKLEGAGREYKPGEFAELRDWLAERLIRKGIVVEVRQ
jgi:hypothetical protein